MSNIHYLALNNVKMTFQKQKY